MANNKQSLYITISRAKSEYYLTDSMFRDIGSPDKLATNPHYKKAAPMKLYLIERIEKWVSKNMDRVEKARIRREKLSKIQLEIHQKKREEMAKMANDWQPRIFEVPLDVTENAIDYYHWRYLDFDGELTLNGLVAYIRHTHTDYEQFLEKIESNRGKTGVGLLYLPLRDKVDKLILEFLETFEYGI